MVEAGGGGGSSFAVVFFDGEKESNLGDVNISPTLAYKPFQLMLSQRIGISPNQISIYLVDRKRIPAWPFSEDRRRVPITGKVNFGALSRLKDCYFLVVLKRSRKARNRRERTVSVVDLSDLSENDVSPPSVRSAPENLVIVRRNLQRPFYDEITQPDLADLNYRLQNHRIHKENYQIGMANNFTSPNFTSNRSFNPQPFLNIDSSPMVDDSLWIPPSSMVNSNTTKRRVYCEKCANEEKNRSTTSFHPCVSDAVIIRFRTRFGPIRRPSRSIP